MCLLCEVTERLAEEGYERERVERVTRAVMPQVEEELEGLCDDHAAEALAEAVHALLEVLAVVEVFPEALVQVSDPTVAALEGV